MALTDEVCCCSTNVCNLERCQPSFFSMGSLHQEDESILYYQCRNHQPVIGQQRRFLSATRPEPKWHNDGRQHSKNYAYGLYTVSRSVRHFHQWFGAVRVEELTLTGMTHRYKLQDYVSSGGTSLQDDPPVRQMAGNTSPRSPGSVWQHPHMVPCKSHFQCTASLALHTSNMYGGPDYTVRITGVFYALF